MELGHVGLELVASRAPTGGGAARAQGSAGDIVVIHDGHHKDPRADRRHAAETVRLLVPLLRARGFAFGALCEMQTRVGASGFQG